MSRRVLHAPGAAVMALALLGASCQRSPEHAAPPAARTPAPPPEAAPAPSPPAAPAEEPEALARQPQPTPPPAAPAPAGLPPAAPPLAAPPPAEAPPAAEGRDPAAEERPPPAPATARLPAKPDPPAAVRATPASPTEVLVEWQPSGGDPGVAGYEVRGGEDVVRTAGNQVTVARLAPGHRFCFAVSALGAGGLRSDPTDPVCVETLADVTPPAPPAGLVAEAGRGEVRLRWSPATDDVGVVGYEVLRGETLVASGAATSAGETGLASGEHCYTVRALDAGGNRSAPSTRACATPPDVTPPSPPPPPAPSAKGESEVAIAWQPATDDFGVVGYEVWRDGQTVTRVAGPSAVETGLRAGARYCYRVLAFDAAGNRSAPSEPGCTATPDLTPPGAPGRLEAVAAADGRVDLTWAAATDNVAVAGYQVWRDGRLLSRLGAVTAHRDETPKSSAKTCYTVRASDAAGNLSPPSPSACASTPDLTPPSAPPGVAAAAASHRRVVLSWTASTDNFGVAGYEVLRDGAVVARVEATGASEESLDPLREYCYSVRALDGAGNRSPPSTPACARTPDPSLPLPPSNLTAVRTGTDEVELRWDASPTPGVVYVVSWDGSRPTPRDKGRTFGTTPLTRLKVFGRPARERHCYRVLARQGGRDSPESLPVCAGVGSAMSAR